MPLPLIPLVWAGAVALGALGAKKGFDAKKDFSVAKEIGEESQRKYERIKKELDQKRNSINKELEKLGELRISIFTQEIQHLVNVVNRYKKARSNIRGFNHDLELKTQKVAAYEEQVSKAWEIQQNLAAGIGGGALTAVGAYGAVGTLASASTGTAIATLSGVAAKNATLAWLGGGALSAGGFGMAGGMITLGGVVAGPALAVAGFMTASKAEQQLSEAREYEAKVDVACKTIDAIYEGLNGLSMRIKELTEVTLMLRNIYNISKVDNPSQHQLETMVHIGTNLKAALELPVMANDGKTPEGFSVRCQGLLETDGIRA